MAKHHVFLHIGPGAASMHHALRDSSTLATARVVVPAVTARHLHLAGMEVRRTHREEGLPRTAVEGRWAEVCRKALKARTDVVVSQPCYLDATGEQVALALDGLAGLKIHLVVTPGAEPLAHLGFWSDTVKPERIHVLPAGTENDSDALAAAVAKLSLGLERERLEHKLAKVAARRRRLRSLRSVDAA